MPPRSRTSLIEVAAIGHHEATVDRRAAGAQGGAGPTGRSCASPCSAAARSAPACSPISSSGRTCSRSIRCWSATRTACERGRRGLHRQLSTRRWPASPTSSSRLIGGADYPAELMCAALRRGAHVVTANKAAVASHYDALHACAEAGGGDARLFGGGRRRRADPRDARAARQDGVVVAIEGVMNGTANFLLEPAGRGLGVRRGGRQGAGAGLRRGRSGRRRRRP